MRTMAKAKIVVLMLVVSLCWVGPAIADIGIDTGAGGRADAQLDFRINIPTFIYFRVGAGAGVDEVVFSPSEDDIANQGATIASSGIVAVRVVSNGGQVTLSTPNDVSLNSGANSISFAQIDTSNTGNIAPPTLRSNSVPGSSLVATGTAPITVEDDSWTYTYNNPPIPPAPGTYLGTVIYTAAIP